MKKFARKLFCALLVLISVYVSYIGTAARALTEETDDPASFSDLANDFQGEFSAALEQALSEAPAADFSIPANWAINLHILVLPEDESDDDQSAHYQYALYRNSGTPTYTARNAYDKLGRLATKTLSTAAQTSAFHTTQLDYHTGAGGSQTALLQRYQNGSDTAYQYAYDDNGNINKITQGSRSVSYFYDADNQLTRENNQFTTETITYHYDGFGNITRKITYPYTEGAVTQPAPRQKAPQPPEPSGVCVFVLADNPAERTAGQYVVIERDGETDYALLNNGTQRAEAVTLHGTVQMPERVWTSDASLIWVLTEAEAQADGRKLYKNIGLLGDTDGNGVVTGHDAALILRHAVQRITLDANELARGNATGTGRATAADASTITREAVELDTIPPRLLAGIYVTPKWIPEPIEPDLQLNGSTATALVEYEYPEKGWRDQLASVQEYRLNGTVLSPYGAEKTIVYDGSGNPSSYLGKTLKWEGKRLVEIAGVATYAYDENGIRLSKTVGGVETKYYYNGTLLMSMTQGSDTLLFSYDASGQVISVNFNGVEYYYLRNGQGDIVKIIDGNNNEVVTYTYDTWGKQLSCEGTLASSLGTVQPFRYRGYVFDSETGWFYLTTRYYDPSLKRFISSDMLMSTGQGILGYNMYAYCNNNPVRYRDSGGLEPTPNVYGPPPPTPGANASPPPSSTPAPTPRSRGAAGKLRSKRKKAEARAPGNSNDPPDGYSYTVSRPYGKGETTDEGTVFVIITFAYYASASGDEKHISLESIKYSVEGYPTFIGADYVLTGDKINTCTGASTAAQFSMDINSESFIKINDAGIVVIFNFSDRPSIIIRVGNPDSLDPIVSTKK